MRRLDRTDHSRRSTDQPQESRTEKHPQVAPPSTETTRNIGLRPGGQVDRFLVPARWAKRGGSHGGLVARNDVAQLYSEGLEEVAAWSASDCTNRTKTPSRYSRA